LARVIDDAALFADKSTCMPTINAIRLESTAKQLVAIGTDRFTLGASMATYDDDGGPEFVTSLKLAQAQTLSKIAKSCKAAFANVAIKIEDDKITCAFSSGESLTLPVLTNTDAEFPKWRHLLIRPDDDTPVKVVGYNPAFMAKFSRVHGASRMALKFSGPTKPALVSIGTQFVGCIMPVRLGSDSPEWQQPDWIAVAPPVVETPKPATKSVPKPRQRAPRATTSRAKKKAVA
jgi:hypothetical protein